MYQFDGQKLSDAIKKVGISTNALAKRLGYSAPYIHNVKKGDRRVTEKLNKELNEFFIDLTDREKALQKIQELEEILEGEKENE